MQRDNGLFAPPAKSTQEITFGFAEDGTTLKVFFGHGDGTKLAVPMKQTGVVRSGVIPPMPESELCNMIVELIRSMIGNKTYDKIIYVGDVNIGFGAGSPRDFLLDGQLENLLKNKFDPAAPPLNVRKILYSSTLEIVEDARSKLDIVNTNTIVIVTSPELRMRVKEAVEGNEAKFHMANPKVK